MGGAVMSPSCAPLLILDDLLLLDESVPSSASSAAVVSVYNSWCGSSINSGSCHSEDSVSLVESDGTSAAASLQLPTSELNDNDLLLELDVVAAPATAPATTLFPGPTAFNELASLDSEELLKRLRKRCHPSDIPVVPAALMRKRYRLGNRPNCLFINYLGTRRRRGFDSSSAARLESGVSVTVPHLDNKETVVGGLLHNAASSVGTSADDPAILDDHHHMDLLVGFDEDDALFPLRPSDSSLFTTSAKETHSPPPAPSVMPVKPGPADVPGPIHCSAPGSC
jgi:hypothetical protein